jgi:hypothetical protein
MLARLMEHYKLDKAKAFGMHSYSDIYQKIFNDRFSIRKLLEIGIGVIEANQMSGVISLGYQTGNSLRCWRDYFVNAHIYGIDIYATEINEDRISTHLVDQGNCSDLARLIAIIGNDVDIIIDDGSHLPFHQVYSFMSLHHCLKPGGIYVIEDIAPTAKENFRDLSVFPAGYREIIERSYRYLYLDLSMHSGIDHDTMLILIKK